MDARPFAELSDTGLLWLINRVVLHPRGFALGLVKDENGDATGWALVGDGSEPWWFNAGEEQAQFEAVTKLLGGPPGD